MPGTRRTKASSPRYAFKTERELTDTEREKFNKLAIDMKAENPRCGNSLYGTLSFDRRLCAFKCVYITSYGEDDDYMVIYYTLDRKSGEIKSHYHGEEELKLKVSPALERRIIDFLESIKTTRAFSLRKHLLASRKVFLETRHNGARSKSPSKSAGGARKTRRNRH